MSVTLCLPLLLLFLGVAAAADGPALAEPAATLPLWPGDAPGETGKVGAETSEAKGGVTRIANVTKPTLTLHQAPAGHRTGTLVVVCPGGGYGILAHDLEGLEIAAWLNGIGVDAAILKYRVPRREGRPYWEAPLQDAQRTVSMVRSKAQEWGVAADRIGILGFSAGGHLSAITSTRHATRSYAALDAIDQVSCRPDFTVLIYPAYLADGVKLHEEVTVDKATPQAFLVHAANDKISAENSIAYWLALKANGTPADLHVYASGGHGFGLRPDKGGVAASWPARCQEWMKACGLLGR